MTIESILIFGVFCGIINILISWIFYEISNIVKNEEKKETYKEIIKFDFWAVVAMIIAWLIFYK